YGFSLVLVSADDAEVLVQRREASATESFTDEACASLPPHSALLLRSEAVTFRLLAAQVIQGSRPDLLVVALPLLEQGGLRTELLARERGFVPLVREMLLSGKPNENALSSLADARPTYVEFDPAWDPRLRTHLVPQAFFTRFAAQPVGRSDRREQLERGEQALLRVLTRLQGSASHDLATRTVLTHTLGQRVVLLTALGDRETAEPMVSDLLALEPRSRVALELQARLRRSPKERLDVSDLFPML
ncbi:MAG TPA: hypothetical protein VMF89_28840, partial [Polyangiales bacterium]|nr:hypothetical protein [Polyangiales bacterium]